MKLSAVVLCGGSSRRMGRDKARLDFHGEALLVRVVRLLETVVPAERIVCVAAIEQDLPALPAKVSVVHDRQPDCGPLEGLSAGLAAAGDLADAVFVTTCDAPLLVPKLALHLADLLGGHDAAVPKIGEQLYPLTAIYHPRVRLAADAMLGRGERRVIDFVAELNTRYVSRGELIEVDPGLLSLRNCNTEEEYRELLELVDRPRV